MAEPNSPEPRTERAICPHCRKQICPTARGRIRLHKAVSGLPGWCPGSGTRGWYPKTTQDGR